MAALKVKLTRGNTSTINNTAITDGQILFDTQTGAQYLDNNTTRISIGQTLTVDTTLSKTSYNPIANIGVAGVMVSSLNTIDSITNEGFITDVLATKQLDINLKANSNRFIFDYQNGKYGYNTDPNRGAGTFSPFSSYAGYTLPTINLLSAWDSSTNSPISSTTYIPLTEAKGISLTYGLGNYNDITANLVDNDGNTTLAFSHSGRGGYSGSYTNNSLDKNYKWMSILVSANGAATNTATVSNINVTT